MPYDPRQMSEWQIRVRDTCRALVPGPPPEPWTNHRFIGAAGIMAGGWTRSGHFLMISLDGYSLTDPLSGKLLLFEQDTDTVLAHLSADDLTFELPGTGEQVRIFGVRAGDGLHVVDGWTGLVIYPWWPNATIVLYRSGPGRQGLADPDNVHALDLTGCSPTGDWHKCGFSPAGDTFAVIGEAGADFFSRVDA